MRDCTPVATPFSMPKSSLSSRVSGRAAQLSATKGRRARGLVKWMALAAISFPVPLSPVIRTLTALSRMRSTRCTTCWIRCPVPMMPCDAYRLSTSRHRWTFCRTSSSWLRRSSPTSCAVSIAVAACDASAVSACSSRAVKTPACLFSASKAPMISPAWFLTATANTVRVW